LSSAKIQNANHRSGNVFPGGAAPVTCATPIPYLISGPGLERGDGDQPALRTFRLREVPTCNEAGKSCVATIIPVAENPSRQIGPRSWRHLWRQLLADHQESNRRATRLLSQENGNEDSPQRHVRPRLVIPKENSVVGYSLRADTIRTSDQCR